MTQFKNFRSPGEDIRIVSTSGHIAIITKDLISLPDVLWKEAYASGAISEEMSIDKNDELSKYIEEQKKVAEDEAAKELAEIKETLRGIYHNPVGVVDDKGKLSTRKAIAAIGKPVKVDIINKLWAELVEELGE